ncbi:hypothetical protein FLW53_23375 [Microbispora sp. SCL1-1]|uniref:hypothetical protein n=1 Tax=unclassified Microbispora TaxID=2614687 RepID=UPI00115B6267|nr:MULTISPECIES: hypothetical protein [unclassified Microbispora]NJP27086.1 hypothetical protein [Microbispora sp. CL1-1]TQS11432.1 hypothetical protein FLW53_23375 [Microbispora sp. SCL1-1]
MNELTAVATASERYLASQAAADADKEALFAAWVAAVQAGRTPEQIAQHCTFTAAYVRRIVRERGAPPLPRGPKSRKQPAE